jgi:hypothetical protein
VVVAEMTFEHLDHCVDVSLGRLALVGNLAHTLVGSPKSLVSLQKPLVGLPKPLVGFPKLLVGSLLRRYQRFDGAAHSPDEADRVPEDPSEVVDGLLHTRDRVGEAVYLGGQFLEICSELRLMIQQELQRPLHLVGRHRPEFHGNPFQSVARIIIASSLMFVHEQGPDRAVDVGQGFRLP